jgi:hypothetical protein
MWACVGDGWERPKDREEGHAHFKTTRRASATGAARRDVGLGGHRDRHADRIHRARCRLGYAYYTTQQLQNAADAAALAGAQRVWFSHDEARQRAMGMSSENDTGGTMVLLDENVSNNASGDIVVGFYDENTRVFTPNDDIDTANAVMVNARRTNDSPNGPLQLVWGGLFGRDAAQFHRWAIAVNTSGPVTNGIIALDEDDPAVVLHARHTVSRRERWDHPGELRQQFGVAHERHAGLPDVGQDEHKYGR